MTRPDWREVMRGCGGVDPRANDLVLITRETASLAANALRRKNAEDFYHNSGAAERELRGVLDEPGEKA